MSETPGERLLQFFDKQRTTTMFAACDAMTLISRGYSVPLMYKIEVNRVARAFLASYGVEAPE